MIWHHCQWNCCGSLNCDFWILPAAGCDQTHVVAMQAIFGNFLASTLLVPATLGCRALSSKPQQPASLLGSTWQGGLLSLPFLFYAGYF